MKLWTWLEIRTKVENDLGLLEENFISPEEMLGYGNEAVDWAEGQILDLYEDYFLNRATLTLVQGQEAYSLPADIYAQKIRRIVYNNGTDIYEITRLRDWKKFEKYADVNLFGVSDRYGYLLTSENAGQQSQLILVPRSRESGAFATIWYLRNANRFVDDTSILDIPEAAQYCIQFIKTRCYEKEGHPSVGKAMMDLQSYQDAYLGTLANMVPDAHNEIEMNLSYYEDFN